ncbi:MAG TPA: ABC transporter permease [Gemmatimonadaceae bacterium]
MEFLASLRFLARRKSVASIAVLTMACALGVNTSALSVLRAFLFSGLGVPEPDRVVHIAPIRELPGRGEVVFSDAFPNYEMIRDSKRAFAEVGVVLQNLVSWRQGTDVRALQNTRASASFFRTMRLSPVLGRTFTPDEEGPSPAPVVVVSHALWTSAFSQDRGVIGRVITLDGVPTTIIGVMPEGFAQPAPTDVWTPFDLPANQRAVVAGGRTLSVFGRIADGVSPAAAAAEVAEFTRRSHAASADNRDYHYRLDTLRDQLLTGAESTVVLIPVAAACLLLLAVLNLVSLLVAWSFERNQEMAVRQALGAGRGQVLRLLVAQSALIVGAGFVVGLGLSGVLLALLRQVDLGPQLGFFMRQARVDTAVLLLCVPLVVMLALLAGVLPALVGRRQELAGALRSSSRSASHSTSAMRLQRALVVVQAALSVVVLASATVIGLSFRNLSAVPDGFSTDRRVVARLVLPDENYGSHARRVAFADLLLAALQREPALAKSAFTSTLPVNDVRWGGRFFVPDASGTISGDPILFHFRRIAPQYPPAMGLPLLRGRLFTARDDSASPRVALISRATAERYWPNENPIGRQIVRAGAGSAPPVPFEIVGVIGDAMDGGYQAPKGEAVYVPFAQVSGTRLSIIVEGRGGTAETVTAIERAVRAADPMVAASGVATLRSLVAGANVLPQLRAAILGLFALAAVLIAALGSYGVMRQLVGNREREFAVRLVFGAVPRDLAREVFLQLARLTVPGVIAGLGGAWIAANLLRTFVFGVDPRSLPVLVAVSLGVLVVAAIAALPSVLRAMRLDPKETMS